MIFIWVDLDQIDKMAPRRVKSAPGAIELNRHFGTETDVWIYSVYAINPLGGNMFILRTRGQALIPLCVKCFSINTVIDFGVLSN